jgi:hypothetical protein
MDAEGANDGARAEDAMGDATGSEDAQSDAGVDTSPDAEPADLGSMDAFPITDSGYCGIPVPGFEGHFSGTAQIATGWTDEPPSCAWKTAPTTTAAAILDIGPGPAHPVSLDFPGHVPFIGPGYARDLPLNFSVTPWEVTTTGIKNARPCAGILFEDSAQATIAIDPGTHAATVSIYCSIGFADGCTDPNVTTTYTMTLALDCVDGKEACVHGSVIACNASGTRTASASCKAPCGPCFAPTPTQCGAGCTSLETDSNNCGTCGHVCPTGESCRAGTCLPTCSHCVSPSFCDMPGTDYEVSNCGACGHACPTTVQRPVPFVGGVFESLNQLCTGGQCTCPSGHPDICTSTTGAVRCVDLQFDSEDCGQCGRACPMADLCVEGTCMPSCAQGLTGCSADHASVCADLQMDDLNCGECFNACFGGHHCVSGHCT